MSYEKDLTEKNEVLSNLCHGYENSKTTSVKTIIQNEELRSINQSLKKENHCLKAELEELKKSTFNVEKDIVGSDKDNPDEDEGKNEIIEIKDKWNLCIWVIF